VRKALTKGDAALVAELQARIRALFWDVYRPFFTLLYVRSCAGSDDPTALLAMYLDNYKRGAAKGIFWSDEVRQRLNPSWLDTSSPTNAVTAECLRVLDARYLKTGIGAEMSSLEEAFKTKYPDAPSDIMSAPMTNQMMQTFAAIFMAYKGAFAKQAPWNFSYLATREPGSPVVQGDCTAEDFLGVHPRIEHSPKRFRQLALASLCDANARGKAAWDELLTERFNALKPVPKTVVRVAQRKPTKPAWEAALDRFFDTPDMAPAKHSILYGQSSRVKLMPIDVVFGLAASIDHCISLATWTPEERPKIDLIVAVVARLCARVEATRAPHPSSMSNYELSSSVFYYLKALPSYLTLTKSGLRRLEEHQKPNFKADIKAGREEALLAIVDAGVEGALRLQDFFELLREKRQNDPRELGGPDDVPSLLALTDCLDLLMFLVGELQLATGCQAILDGVGTVAPWRSCRRRSVAEVDELKAVQAAERPR